MFSQSVQRRNLREQTLSNNIIEKKIRTNTYFYTHTHTHPIPHTTAKMQQILVSEELYTFMTRKNMFNVLRNKKCAYKQTKTQHKAGNNKNTKIEKTRIVSVLKVTKTTIMTANITGKHEQIFLTVGWLLCGVYRTRLLPEYELLVNRFWV